MTLSHRKGRATFVSVLLILGAGLSGLVLAAQDRTADAPKTEAVAQLGHTRGVTSVVFSSDGRFVLSGSMDETLKLWDVDSGRLIRTFAARDSITSVAFSPDVRLALSGSMAGNLALWDVTSGREIWAFTGHAASVRSVSFSPDGHHALSGSDDNTLKLWDVVSRAAVSTFKGHSGSVGSVAFSPNGRLALSGDSDGMMKLWDVILRKEIRTFTGHKSSVTSVNFSADGLQALSGSRDDTMKLWDIASGRELHSFALGMMVFSVAISPDKAKGLVGGCRDEKEDGVISCDIGALKLLDLESKREIRGLSGHTKLIRSVGFSPDGRSAVSGSDDRSLKLWNVASGLELKSFSWHPNWISRSAFSPNDRLALSASDDHSLKLWDLTTGRLLRTFAGHTAWVQAVAFSPDGRFALSGSNDNTMKLWDVGTGRELRSFLGHKGWIRSVAISPDGRLAASASLDRTLRLWDTASGREIRTITTKQRVNSVAFSPDGQFILSGGMDPTLNLWLVDSGQLVRMFTGHTGSVQSIAYSPSGRFAVSGSSDGTLKIWEVASGREIRTFAGRAGGVLAVAFSPDEGSVLSGNMDGTLKFWDVSSGREIKSLTGHKGSARSAAFSSNGKIILSGSDDGTIRLWDADRGKELLLMLAGGSTEWLSMTPVGFFDAAGHGERPLHIVRGLDVTAIDQLWQSLYDPDLVRENLAGDPDKEVEKAAAVVNLEKVLDSGSAPLVEVASSTAGGQSPAEVITVAGTITEQEGGGIGRIEWRVNGVTAGVETPPSGTRGTVTLKRELALDPDENTIEVVAYNGRNLLASLPASTTVTWQGPAEASKGRLFVLAIGIDAYSDPKFRRLNLAVKDATEFAAALKKAGEGEYASVHVVPALDGDATLEKLDTVLDVMARDITPRDTFILFAAAHGTSVNGRFYLIPYGYSSETPGTLADKAISQEKLQEWLANRIRAKKALILLDTCESGATVAAHTKSRTDAPASEAAVGRLHEATGRPVLTAAASGNAAVEGYREHGIFTWAVLDAFKNGDTNTNGSIELSELAAHVQDLVPKLSAEMRGEASKGDGRDQGERAALTAPMPEDTTRFAAYRQSARFGSRGENFVVAKRLTVPAEAPAAR
jgi:WD40 repeat protein